MNIILLSGGSGKRLWPLSNAVRSKQFIKLFKNENGTYESMVQRVYRQIRTAIPKSQIIITTEADQKSAVQNQLGKSVGICVEPFRRDTFPAIALAVSYLKSERGMTDDDVAVVCPVDPYTEIGYFEKLTALENAVRGNYAQLAVMGVQPTYPSAKYGYILTDGAENSGGIMKVSGFREKPSEAAAKELIARGALWNCGVFAFRIGYIAEIVKQYMPYCSYSEVFLHYKNFPKTSFDYAVAEKEPNMCCVKFKGVWKDVGTWNTLSEEMSTATIGNVMMGDNCENVHVINELDVPILVMGAKNMIVAASSDGVIVSDKHASSFIKPYVDQFTQRAMYEEKSWGDFRILRVDEHAMTLSLSLKAGHSMSYHCHHQRDEVWTILSGEGIVTLGERERKVGTGSVIQIPAGVRHTIRAVTDMEISEIQLGNIEDADIEADSHDREKKQAQ